MALYYSVTLSSLDMTIKQAIELPYATCQHFKVAVCAYVSPYFSLLPQTVSTYSEGLACE